MFSKEADMALWKARAEQADKGKKAPFLVNGPVSSRLERLETAAQAKSASRPDADRNS